MANPNFTATMSSNEIWRDLDDTRCITDDLDTIEADILELEQNKANADHTHIDYAPMSHTHPDYAYDQHNHSYNDLSDKPTIPVVPFIEDTTYPGCFYRTVNDATEWINPPLMVGVEYRTVERWLGEPVYVKVFDFGTLPNNNIKSKAHNIPNIKLVFDVFGQTSYASSLQYHGVTGMYANRTNIVISTNADLSGITAYVAIKYTKLTN